LQALIRTARNHQNSHINWAEPPEGPVIVIPDAAMEDFKDGNQITIYLILIRSISSNTAVIMPPVILYGRETSDGWDCAFSRLPRDLHSRIVALVCDGHVGIVRQAKINHWVLQRCHFHIIQGINNYLKPGRLSRSNELTPIIHDLIKTVLCCIDDEKAQRAIWLLEIYAKCVKSKGARQVLSGFTKHWLDYRAYLYNNEMRLPCTSNSAESCFSLIRTVQGRANGFRTEKSFLAWLEFMLKRQQTMTCRQVDYLHKYVV